MKRVAVVIPSLDSPLLDRVVTAVLEQDGAGDLVDEVVVVGRDTPRLMPSSPAARLLNTGRPIPPGAARNRGIGATRAPLLIFLDSDCLPQPGWLRAHVAAHDAGHTVVGGSVLPDGDGYWHLTYNLTMFHALFPGAPAGSRPFLPTLNLSVERRVVGEVGLLDEALPRSQDVDWTTRMAAAGHQPVFWPAAIVQHRHNRRTFSAVWRDCARSGEHARRVRLNHATTLGTPAWLRSRALTLALSPLIAAGVTAGIVGRRRATFARYPATIPGIYLTKLAWCWGAARPNGDGHG